MNYLAIDVGGTFIKYAVLREDGTLLQKAKTPTAADTLPAFLDALAGIWQSACRACPLAGIALSMPGMIDSGRGFLYTGGSLRCVTDLNIVEVLRARCGVPVSVENDAKCAALAELWLGSLANVRNAVVLVCGTGVGGAVILDRKVLAGKHFMAGEFSYMLTDGDAPYAMENCLAEKAGIQALLREVGAETGLDAGTLDGEQVFRLANGQDPAAMAGLRRFVRRLAVQIHNCQYMFDPECFAIGGGISEQPLFLQMIREELQKINGIFPWTLPVPQIVPCHFYNDANLVGAVYVHLQQYGCAAGRQSCG